MDDLISRQAFDSAFTMLRFDEYGTIRHWGDRQNWCMSGQEVEDLINSIPPVSSAQRWIPCSERLPKVGRTVICQCRADILKLLKLDSGGDWYQDAEHVYMSGFVIAWMPLPEPYKGGQE